jgi:hypothetical protein
LRRGRYVSPVVPLALLAIALAALSTAPVGGAQEGRNEPLGAAPLQFVNINDTAVLAVFPVDVDQVGTVLIVRNTSSGHYSALSYTLNIPRIGLADLDYLSLPIEYYSNPENTYILILGATSNATLALWELDSEHMEATYLPLGRGVQHADVAPQWNRHSVLIATVSASGEVELAEYPLGSTDPLWSLSLGGGEDVRVHACPGGGFLAVVSGDSGISVYRIAGDGSIEGRVDAPLGLGATAVLKNCGELAVASESQGLSMLNLATGAIVGVESVNGSSFQLYPSPHEEFLAIVADKETSQAVYIVSASGTLVYEDTARSIGKVAWGKSEWITYTAELNTQNILKKYILKLYNPFTGVNFTIGPYFSIPAYTWYNNTLYVVVKSSPIDSVRLLAYNLTEGLELVLNQSLLTTANLPYLTVVQTHAPMENWPGYDIVYAGTFYDINTGNISMRLYGLVLARGYRVNIDRGHYAYVFSAPLVCLQNETARETVGSTVVSYSLIAGDGAIQVYRAGENSPYYEGAGVLIVVNIAARGSEPVNVTIENPDDVIFGKPIILSRGSTSGAELVSTPLGLSLILKPLGGAASVSSLAVLFPARNPYDSAIGPDFAPIVMVERVKSEYTSSSPPQGTAAPHASAPLGGSSSTNPNTSTPTGASAPIQPLQSTQAGEGENHASAVAGAIVVLLLVIGIYIYIKIK